MKFSDGMEFDLSGPMRIEERSDGLYVVGNNMLIPVKTVEDGLSIIRKEDPNYEIDKDEDDDSWFIIACPLCRGNICSI